MASISGNVTIAGDPDDWIAVAWDADTHAYAGVSTVSGGAYEITGLTAGKAYVVGCRPKSGGIWTADKAINADNYILASDPENTPYYFKATDLSGGDASFDLVTLLMPCDGDDESTTFTDIIGHTMTGAGNAQIDTAQSKYGGASLLLDGTGDSVSSGSSADFGFGTDDFTIEFWFRPSALSRAESIVTIVNDSSNKIHIWYDSSNKLYAQFLVGGAQVREPYKSGLTSGAWQHCAIVRSSNTVTVYIGGAPGTGATVNSNLWSSATVNLGLPSSGAYNALTGHIDDIRITNGLARYTSTFTPPAAAHPTSKYTTGNSEPTWPTTPGNTVVDNDVTWTNMGQFVRPLMHGPLIAA